MNATLQNHGRSLITERQEATANGTCRPVGVKVTVKLSYGDETPEQRRKRHARESGSSSRAWL